MPEGIIATDDGNGFTTLDFVDKSLAGPALAELIEIGGSASIETITRVGPRRMYRVPTGNAEEAGLLDEDTGTRTRSAGYDTGYSSALVAADPNVNPGDDDANWHTPVDQYTSANAYVGTVPNDDVLDRVQVHTGDAGSYGGSGETMAHGDLVALVREASNEAYENRTPVIPQNLIPVSQINLALKDQPGALGTDPNAQPTAGGQYIGEYEPMSTMQYAGDVGGDGDTPGYVPPSAEYPEGEEPSMEWTRAQLDAYALAVKEIDTTGLPNKQAVIDAIAAAPDPTP